MNRTALTIIFAMIFFSACTPKATQTSVDPTTVSTPTLEPSITPVDIPTATATTAPSLTRTPLAEGRVVIKKTAGLPITGTLYGHGQTAVILASQGGTSESEWGFFAKYLAQNGFTALAISSPDSQGDTVVLVGMAIQFLRENGFRHIVCAGASNGASGCVFNLGEPEITGLLLITYHGAANLSKVSLPKLFVAGEQADPWRATTEKGFKAAGDPKTLILVPGTPGTGPSILEVNQDIKKQILDFLKKCNGL
jgi:hypothetical protein